MNKCYEALSWAIKLMPTGKAQAGLTALYNSMPQSSEKEEDEVVIAMAGAVYDGLRCGNWPGLTHEECVELLEKRDARRLAKGE